MSHDAGRTPLSILSEEEETFQRAIRSFAEETVKPRRAAMDRAGAMDKEIIDACFELGLMGIEVPVEEGGQGGSFFQSVLCVEELARVDPSVAVMVDVQATLVENLILRWATKEQRARVLPRLCKDTIAAYALSESVSGSDAFALQCRAKDAGDHYLLSGRKLWITNGGEAGLFAVFATVDPALGYKGITCFLVERDSPGFSIGKKEDKLGIRASSTVELIFEDTPVPKANVVGEVGKGYKVAIETLNEGRIGIGAQMVGLAQGAFEATRDYVAERSQFGKKIGEFQAVQFALADMATDIAAARLLVYEAARLRDAGKPFMLQAAQAKLFSSRVAERVSSKAVELFGGNGFTKEYPVEKFFRDAKIGQIYEGTTNMQLQTIAKNVMK
jgi:alkylation response protein AidB-like acyl-CoA dehydrogenase